MFPLGHTCTHPVSYFCGIAQVIGKAAPPSQTRGSRGEGLVCQLERGNFAIGWNTSVKPKEEECEDNRGTEA